MKLGQLIAKTLYLLGAAGFTASVNANADIRSGVHDYLQHQFQTYLEQGYDRIDVRVNQLDPRLKLQACQAPLAFEQSNFRGLSNQATVRVSCTSPKPWSIFLGARISAYAKIAVAAQPLVRGHILQNSDLIIESRKVSVNQPLVQREQVIGLQLKRPLPQGEAFKSSYLMAPKVIRRGDTVVLAARLGSAMVATDATAMADGKLGQQIRVKNNRSDQIVMARVVAAGRVEVVL